MRMYDIIVKKRNGHALTEEELTFFLQGCLQDEIPDYQTSALLMAIYFQGMTDTELSILTRLMATSGQTADLSAIQGIKADKHSTGGVGDKTTLIIAPIVAACGGKVAKMSGRGLGHTGGTVDKLESIPGLKTDLDQATFFSIVNTHGLSVIGQSDILAPADKKLYALRDVTGTVESIPLIAASIMSKKLASGSDVIVLDVKVGSGAFMKNLDDAILLAEKMVQIGERNGRKTMALLTNMDKPLGCAIGNALEVQEVIDVLNNKGPWDLTEESIELAANMLCLSGLGSLEQCRKNARQSLQDGTAKQKFEAMVSAQGGDSAYIRGEKSFPAAAFRYELKASTSGRISHMNAEKCGIASVILGAGRATKEDHIDMAAGIELLKKSGDPVQAGDVLAIFHTDREETIADAVRLYESALSYSSAGGDQKEPLILARVTAEETSRFVEDIQ